MLPFLNPGYTKNSIFGSGLKTASPVGFIPVSSLFTSSREFFNAKTWTCRCCTTISLNLGVGKWKEVYRVEESNIFKTGPLTVTSKTNFRLALSQSMTKFLDISRSFYEGLRMSNNSMKINTGFVGKFRPWFSRYDGYQICPI